jgi:hypothetical protein
VKAGDPPKFSAADLERHVLLKEVWRNVVQDCAHSVLDLIRTKECAICELTSVDIDRIKRVGSDGGLDIEVDGIEVGSYGRRWFQFLDGLSFDYAYGTGLALPRFTIAENGVTK